MKKKAMLFDLVSEITTLRATANRLEKMAQQLCTHIDSEGTEDEHSMVKEGVCGFCNKKVE